MDIISSMRLDQYITKHFDIQSRNKALELIKENKIKVNDSIITKPSYKVVEDDIVVILDSHQFVSRAGYKLQYFFDENPLIIKDFHSLDIGSSTGGFTQVLLKHNVSSVTCVDVGNNQLHESIKDDPKIKMYENTDIRNFQSSTQFDLVTCDVSFISLHNIINDIDRLSKQHIIILFKPQFEVGINAKRDKKGVVKDQKAIDLARLRFEDAAKLLGWTMVKHTESKLQGKEGNSEEFYYFTKITN